MQIIFFIIGVIVVIFNDYSTSWSSMIFPLMVGILLIVTSLYSIFLNKKEKKKTLDIDTSVIFYHLLVLVTILVVLSITNIYFSTLCYVLLYKLVDNTITFKKQILIIISLITLQVTLKTFLYFNI